MDELVTWLREQIAQDERIARAAHERLFVGFIGQGDRAYFEDKGFGFAASAHIARQRPLDVLAQCEAHTAILDACLLGVTQDDAVPFGSARADLADDVLWALACAYRHRLGFRQEWRPAGSPEVAT